MCIVGFLASPALSKPQTQTMLQAALLTFKRHNSNMPLKISHIYWGSFFSPVKEEQNFTSSLTSLFEKFSKPRLLSYPHNLLLLECHYHIWGYPWSILQHTKENQYTLVYNEHFKIFYIWSRNKASLKIMKWSTNIIAKDITSQCEAVDTLNLGDWPGFHSSLQYDDSTIPAHFKRCLRHTFKFKKSPWSLTSCNVTLEKNKSCAIHNDWSNISSMSPQVDFNTVLTLMESSETSQSSIWNDTEGSTMPWVTGLSEIP